MTEPPLTEPRCGPLAIGLFYGSTNGDTHAAAVHIAARCATTATPWAEVTLHDVATVPLQQMTGYNYIIIGASTWNIGQLQRDREDVFADFDELDLTGKQVAIFGLGDQVGYPDTFVDAMAFFADKVIERGAELVGRWPANGYTFAQSWALGDDGSFVGLVLDELNQPALNDTRIVQWLAQLQAEWDREEDGEEGEKRSINE